ncbi:MAG TPA: SlyX family protein [Xylella taiwanensis]
MHEEALIPRDCVFEARLIELETRLSFQEQALAEISEALAETRLIGTRNAELIRHLLEELGKVRNTLYVDPIDEPPPHY